MLTIIAATDSKGGIGKGGKLPWHIPEELAHFKLTTTGHTVIMGRKTYESIGRPLPNRRNIVLSRQPDLERHPGVIVMKDFPQPAIPAFVIGGADIYAQALPLADRMILTRITGDFDCDTFFPEYDPAEWVEMKRRSYFTQPHFTVTTYHRLKRHNHANLP